jgi:hypothetical protein
MRAANPALPGAISVEALGPRLILTTLVGRTDRSMSDAAWQDFQRIVCPLERPVWVSDASALTGFEPATLALGARWFSHFRERGGRDCLVVSHWPTAMMAASTMALGLGVRIHSFRTLEAARSHANVLLTG